MRGFVARTRAAQVIHNCPACSHWLPEGTLACPDCQTLTYGAHLSGLRGGAAVGAGAAMGGGAGAVAVGAAMAPGRYAAGGEHAGSILRKSTTG